MHCAFNEVLLAILAWLELREMPLVPPNLLCHDLDVLWRDRRSKLFTLREDRMMSLLPRTRDTYSQITVWIVNDCVVNSEGIMRSLVFLALT